MFTALRPPPFDITKIMEAPDGRSVLDDTEEEAYEYITGWNSSDDEACENTKSIMRNLTKLRQQRIALLTRLNTGGRARRREQRPHSFYDTVIREDMYGVPAFTDADGVHHPSRPPYMSEYQFNRRFRVGPKRFARLLYEIQHPDTGHVDYRTGPDATGLMGVSALQKLVATFRILAYGTSFDSVHVYAGVQEEVATSAFYGFCDWLIARYGPTYMGVWTPEAIKKEMEKNAERGFTGMLGSIDCTHWHWKNCPMPWAGQFQDRNGHRSVIAEAIAGHDMYIWHAFFGCPGSLNDINVLGFSTLSGTYLRSAAATTKYTIDDTEFEGAYFLADGIYPPYAYLMKTISNPTNPKDKLFAKRQEAVRKDVERAFGRLLIKWHILNCASRTWFIENVKKIWQTCFILHNMTLRDNEEAGYDSDEAKERDVQRTLQQKREEERIAIDHPALPRVVRVNAAVRPRTNLESDLDVLDEQIQGGPAVGIPQSAWDEVLRRLGHMQCRETNQLLKEKTVNALWTAFGNEP